MQDQQYCHHCQQRNDHDQTYFYRGRGSVEMQEVEGEGRYYKNQNIGYSNRYHEPRYVCKFSGILKPSSGVWTIRYC